MRKLSSRLLQFSFTRFLLSGGFNTALTYALYLGLLEFFPYQISYSIAYASGIILAFILNRFFVFKSHRGLRSILLFPFVYLIQYSISMATVWVWVEKLHQHEKLAPLIAVAITVPMTYFFSRFIFSKSIHKTQPENNFKNKRIVFLDYLRIFAFVSVLIGHKFYAYILAISNDTTIHSTPRVIASLLLPIFQGGGAGVVVFFLVSGYIITHVLQTEQTLEFVVKRIFRVYPLYIFAVLTQFIILSTLGGGQAQSITTLLLQLLLIGDLFGTPYALNGVEWTLRVELTFYVLMSILHSVNLLSSHKKILPYIFILLILLNGSIAPIPSADIWSKGYFTLYGPFLFLGSTFYLYEKKQINLTFLLIFISLIFYKYFLFIAIYQKYWITSHFAIWAFIIFLFAWLIREKININPAFLLLSELTYSVYLFHNWLFDYAKLVFYKFNIEIINPDIQALVSLLLFCFFIVKYIEKPSINIGKYILKNYNLR